MKVAVIACVSPLARDVAHSVNTLRYAKGVLARPNVTVMQKDDANPMLWGHGQACEWLARVSKRLFPKNIECRHQKKQSNKKPITHQFLCNSRHCEDFANVAIGRCGECWD